MDRHQRAPGLSTPERFHVRRPSDRPAGTKPYSFLGDSQWTLLPPLRTNFVNGFILLVGRSRHEPSPNPITRHAIGKLAQSVPGTGRPHLPETPTQQSRRITLRPPALRLFVRSHPRALQLPRTGFHPHEAQLFPDPHQTRRREREALPPQPREHPLVREPVSPEQEPDAIPQPRRILRADELPRSPLLQSLSERPDVEVEVFVVGQPGDDVGLRPLLGIYQVQNLVFVLFRFLRRTTTLTMLRHWAKDLEKGTDIER